MRAGPTILGMGLGSAVLGLALVAAPASVGNGVAFGFAPTVDAFPPAWSRPDVNAQAEPLDGAEVVRSRVLVQRAMAAYPGPVIAENLRRVFVFRTLTFYGLAYGGTNSNDTVYLTNQGPERGYTERYIIGSFHHEFSSILFRNYARHLDRRAWKAANRPGFAYGDGGAAALKAGRASTAYEPRFMADGFMCEYATASLEEDFNTLAEAVFMSGPELRARLDDYPRLRRKAILLGRFYVAVDPGFAAGPFGELARLDQTRPTATAAPRRPQ